ncbi:MAG: hypothetical protein KAT75_06245, partial [Dehalococcoidia bacterium]|nr:hypothetical protein [Dehalococcoidia bacterium]
MRKEGKTKEAPASELELLRQRISQLETSEAKRRQGEEAANTLIHDLRERVKELSCLYRISDFAAKEDISLERILEQTVNLIPAAWQYPQITCARITLDGREFRTENFRETTWKLLRDIIVHGCPAGTVEVCYLEEKPKSDEGPFLKQEGELISAIAKQLGEITRRKQMEEEIQESETRYRLVAENATDVIWTVDMNMRPT